MDNGNKNLLFFSKYLYTFFVINMIYSFSFDLPVIILFYSEPKH